MSFEHHNHPPAVPKGDDVQDAGDRMHITTPITHRHEPSHHGTTLSHDDISSRNIPDPSTTQDSCSANFAPTIPSSNQTHVIPTTTIAHDYDNNPERDVAHGHPQMWVSTPPHHPHHYQETPEETERHYIENLRRGRNAALSAECDQIEKQKIDTTIGSIRGLFGRGRHRDAWLIGCDTDATDFGGKMEGKIDAGRDRLSSYGTGRDKMVGTITGREKLAREQDVKINSLLASRRYCTRRRGAGTTSGSPVAGRSTAVVAGNNPLDEPEASGNDEEISVVRR